MSRQLEQELPTHSDAVWCGRSWDALVDRRCDAFEQAQMLRLASDKDLAEVVSDFLMFFDEMGVSLFRDEEEWLFRGLPRAPEPVVRALQERMEISLSIAQLIDEVRSGVIDLEAVHALGAALESHILTEEEDVRPLFRDRPRLRLAP